MPTLSVVLSRSIVRVIEVAVEENQACAMSCVFIDFVSVPLVLFRCASVLTENRPSNKTILDQNFTVESIQIIKLSLGNKPCYTDLCTITDIISSLLHGSLFL